MVEVCWLAQFAPAVSCRGPVVRCHLVPKQTIRREVWNQREALRPLLVQLGKVFPSTLRLLQGDPRCWRLGCEIHHHMLDSSRKLRIPRERLPRETEAFCSDYGLLWWLDREYGELAA